MPGLTEWSKWLYSALFFLKFFLTYTCSWMGGNHTLGKFFDSFPFTKLLLMNITFEELRRIKHALPQGSIARIAEELNVDEQTVRNYFGAHQYKDGQVVEFHLEPGPNGGIVHIEDTRILDRAQEILSELNRDN